MRLVVTGSLGFVGGAICEWAPRYGHEVVLGIDDLSGNVYPPDDKTLTHTLGYGMSDQLRSSDWIPFDCVIHCAAPVGAAAVIGRRCVQEIVMASDDAFDIAMSNRAWFINISSSEVYGAHGINAESDPAIVPTRFSDRMTYAVGKLAAEHQLAQRSRHAGVPLAQIRPFNLVGHRQDSGKGFVVPRFAEAAVRDGELTVFGDGSQRRAFTHVEDFARFVLGMLDRPQTTAWDGVPFNVGAETNVTSIANLAKAFVASAGTGAIVNTNGRAVFGDGYEEAEARTKLPHIQRAHIYGWDPQWTLPEIIRAAIADAKMDIAREANYQAQVARG